MPIAPLPPYDRDIMPGLAVTFAAYNQDRSQVMLADLGCRVVAISPAAEGNALVTHNCAGTYGSSGAPLLTRAGTGWALVAINLAAGSDSNLALAKRFTGG